MRCAGAFLTLVLFVLPALAYGQSDEKDRPDAVRWQEVERGLYATGTFGVGVLLNPPGGASSPMMGLSMGVAFGYDLLDQLQVEGFVTGAQLNAPAGYGGLGEPADPRGDFSSLLVGAKVRFHFLKVGDVQQIHRLFVGVQAGGGMLFSDPGSVFSSSRPAALGGVGVRYYTRMRHFSVGVDLDAAYGMGINTIALLPQVSLSYTF